MNEIVVFAKAPVPGKVKTRLGSVIGMEQAARGHAAFIKDLLTTLSRSESGVVVAVGAAEDLEHPAFSQIGAELVVQPTGTLGDRLKGVIGERFLAGAQKVLVVGTDSPTLRLDLFHEAFALLDQQDVVMGPSFDGGYYLLGTSAHYPELFENISWSTSEVASQTLNAAQSLKLKTRLLEFWYDVDTIEDLKFLRFHLMGFLCHDARLDGCSELPFPATSQWLSELESSRSVFSK